MSHTYGDGYFHDVVLNDLDARADYYFMISSYVVLACLFVRSFFVCGSVCSFVLLVCFVCSFVSCLLFVLLFSFFDRPHEHTQEHTESTNSFQNSACGW